MKVRTACKAIRVLVVGAWDGPSSQGSLEAQWALAVLYFNIRPKTCRATPAGRLTRGDCLEPNRGTPVGRLTRGDCLKPSKEGSIDSGVCKINAHPRKPTFLG